MFKTAFVVVFAIAAALAIPFASAAILDPVFATAAGVVFATAMVGIPLDFTAAKELRQARAKLVEDNKATLDKIKVATDEARVKELETEWDKRDADIEAMTAKIKRAERQEQLDIEAAAPVSERRSGRDVPGNVPANPEQRQNEYRDAFVAYCRGGRDGLTPEQNAVLHTGWQAEGRAAQTVTTTGGGYLIPTGFSNNLEKAMLDYSGVMSAATMLRTDSGNSLPWPTVNDTSNKGALLGINTQESEQAITFGVFNLDAYKFTSKSVLVPIELMDDSAFDFDGVVTPLLAERVGRILEQYCTTGTGSNQPNGIVTASTAGVTGSSATAITVDDLIDLQHSVDPAYRRAPGAAFMFSDSTLKAIKKLKDSQNRPLWLAGYDVNEPDTILGQPYFINQEMAAIGASAKSVLFGDLSKYIVRTVKDMRILRLVERYADYYQVGFQLFVRADGDLLNAGTNPVKHLVHQSA
jgi:HK97 family phage major capsid protein